MKRIIVSTKLLPTVRLKKDEKRSDFFKQMRKIGYQYLHFDFNRFEVKELLDEKWMMRVFDDIISSDIHILNSHLFVNPYDNIWINNENEQEMIMWKVLEQCLKYNKMLQIKHTVYHVPELKHLDVVKCQRYISNLPRLLETASKYENSICLENHYNAEVDNFILSYLFQRFDEDILGLTFDTGHYFLSGNDKIAANDFFGCLRMVHLNDNDRKMDLHQIPDITGKRNVWNKIFMQIKRNSVMPSLIFEITQDVMKHSEDYIECLEWMYEKFCNVIEYYNRIEV